MKRPNIYPIFTEESEFCEKSSSKQMSDFVPHQSYKISELVSRFERGQRLPVHMNFKPGSNFQAISDEQAEKRINAEQFHDCDFAPTDVHDVVDVQAHYNEHQEHKKDFADRQKKAKQAKQAQQAQQAQQPPTPPDPAKPSQQSPTLPDPAHTA